MAIIWKEEDFFSSMFDFNSDGQADAIEEALGYQILDELSHEDNESGNDDDKN